MGKLITTKKVTVGYYDEMTMQNHRVTFEEKPQTLKVLIYDFGLYVEHAARLARDGNEVKYYVEASTAFPVFSNYAPGMGIKGIEKVDDFFEWIDWADLIMFPDIDAGDLCDFLRGLGYVVYGAGNKGEAMENERFNMKKIQYSLGLPTQKTIMVKGTAMIKKYLTEGLVRGEFEYIEGQEGLLDFINQKGNVFIKLDKYRGDMETFYAKDYESIRTILDYIDVSFGPFKDTYNFIIEECKEGVEIGFDCFFNGREFLKPYLVGYEKKSAYIGVHLNEMSYPIQRVMDALTSYLQKINYRGALSTELMIGEDGKPYLIDITARFPNPLSLIYTESIKNYSEVIYAIALGKSITLDIKGKYCGCIPFKDIYALDHYVQIEITPKHKNDIKLSMGCMFNGHYFGVKGMEVIATPIAVESSIEKVVSKLLSLAPEVNAHQIQKGNMGDIYELEDEIIKGEKIGIKFK